MLKIACVDCTAFVDCVDCTTFVDCWCLIKVNYSVYVDGLYCIHIRGKEYLMLMNVIVCVFGFSPTSAIRAFG